MTGYRRSLTRAAVGVAWRVLVALFVLTYLWRSLLILAALVAAAVAVLAAAAATVRALLLWRRGW